MTLTDKFAAQVLVLTLLIWSIVPAQADPIQDFALDAQIPGGISYVGGATPLTGTNIAVDAVIGLSTPSNDSVLRKCLSCTLNFTTGNLTGRGSTHWYFGGAGSTTIVGGIDSPDISFATPTGTTLLTGTISSAELTNGVATKATVTSFENTKDATLASFYGLSGGPSTPWIGALNISFTATRTAPNFFTSSRVLTGNIASQPVPEPLTMLLFGLGLIGLAVWIRRRKA